MPGRATRNTRFSSGVTGVSGVAIGSMAVIYAISNQKGGVGKTTLTLCLAAELANRGKKVLVVNTDPQANATDALAPTDFDADDEPTLFDVYSSGERGAAEKAAIETTWPGVSLLPGDIQLARMDSNRERGAEQKLKAALTGVNDWDSVLIDCPRALGPLTDAALVAATHLVVVAEPTKDSLKGIGLVKETAETVKELYNPSLVQAGVILNRVGRTAVKAARAQELLDALGDEVWTPYIPEWAVMAKPAEFGIQLRDIRSDAKANEAVERISALVDHMLESGIQ